MVMYPDSVCTQAETESSSALNSGFGDAIQTHLVDLRDLLAVQQMDERGARFVVWRLEMMEGRERKMPLRINGLPADSTKAATWSTLEEALEAVPRLNATGVGFVLATKRDAEAGLEPIVGVDLDGCRDPGRGAIEPWALEIIRDFNSYAEISPSGTGVKLLALVDPSTRLLGGKRVIQAAAGTVRSKQVEVYVDGRFFTITGQALDWTPDELTNATEAYERLTATIAPFKAKANGKAESFKADGEEPSAETMVAIKGCASTRRIWEGRKTSGDVTASGLDASLAAALGALGLSDEEIARALCHFPYGQIGGGKLRKRDEVERQLGRLLRITRDVRDEKNEQVAHGAMIAGNLLASFQARREREAGEAVSEGPLVEDAAPEEPETPEQAPEPAVEPTVENEVEGEETVGEEMAVEAQAEAEADADPLTRVPVTSDGLFLQLSMRELALQAPGVLGDIVLWMDHSAMYPQPELELAAGLTFYGTLMGHRYRLGKPDTRSSIYALSLAESGHGKEHSRQCIKLLARELGMGYCVGEMPRSDAGIYWGLFRWNCRVYTIDEIGHFLQGVLNPRAPQYLAEIMRTVTSVWSSCTTWTTNADKGDLRDGGDPVSINQALLCINGSSVASEVWAALKGRNVANGSLARFLLFEANDELPKRRDDVPEPAEGLPWIMKDAWSVITKSSEEPTLLRMGLERIRTVTQYDEQGRPEPNPPPRPYVVPFDEEALQLGRLLADYADNLKRQLKGKAEQAIVARFYEHVRRVALVAAVCGNPSDPVVRVQHLRWAATVVKHSTDRMLAGIKVNISSNEHEAAQKAVLEKLAKLGPKGAWVPRWKLGRELRSLKELDAVLKQLQDNEEIEATKADPAKDGGRPGLKYRLASG
jgi:hypothetical protein